MTPKKPIYKNILYISTEKLNFFVIWDDGWLVEKDLNIRPQSKII